MAEPRKLRTRKVRLNLQIDEGLKEWVRRYAKRKHTNLTQLIVDHFVKLKEENQ